MGEMLGALDAVQGGGDSGQSKASAAEPVKARAEGSTLPFARTPIPTLLLIRALPLIPILPVAHALTLSQAGDAKVQYLEWVAGLMASADEGEKDEWYNRLHYGDQVRLRARVGCGVG